MMRMFWLSMALSAVLSGPATAQEYPDRYERRLTLAGLGNAKNEFSSSELPGKRTRLGQAGIWAKSVGPPLGPDLPPADDVFDINLFVFISPVENEAESTHALALEALCQLSYYLAFGPAGTGFYRVGRRRRGFRVVGLKKADACGPVGRLESILVHEGTHAGQGRSRRGDWEHRKRKEYFAIRNQAHHARLVVGSFSNPPSPADRERARENFSAIEESANVYVIRFGTRIGRDIANPSNVFDLARNLLVYGCLKALLDVGRDGVAQWK